MGKSIELDPDYQSRLTRANLFKTMTQAVIARDEVISPEPQSPERLFTFAEYLNYEGEPDVRYELFRGKLIPMPAHSHLHTNIGQFLLYYLQHHLADYNLDLVATALGTGVRTEENSARIPDVVVYSKTIWEQVRDRSGAGVLDFAEKPLLVVEIVSTNRRDDYVIKRNEYEVAEIAEYWIVDPKKQRVRVFRYPTHEEGYDYVDFSADQVIISGELAQLSLSVQQLLHPPLVEDLIKAEQAKLKTLETAAERERQRAETERQRAEKLAQRLREMGVNPDELE